MFLTRTLGRKAVGAQRLERTVLRPISLYEGNIQGKIGRRIKSSAREAKYLAELGMFIRPVRNQVPPEQGIIFAESGNYFSRHQEIAVSLDRSL